MMPSLQWETKKPIWEVMPQEIVVVLYEMSTTDTSIDIGWIFDSTPAFFTTNIPPSKRLSSSQMATCGMFIVVNLTSLMEPCLACI